MAIRNKSFSSDQFILFVFRPIPLLPTKNQPLMDSTAYFVYQFTYVCETSKTTQKKLFLIFPITKIASE